MFSRMQESSAWVLVLGDRTRLSSFSATLTKGLGADVPIAAGDGLLFLREEAGQAAAGLARVYRVRAAAAATIFCFDGILGLEPPRRARVARLGAVGAGRPHPALRLVGLRECAVDCRSTHARSAIIRHGALGACRSCARPAERRRARGDRRGRQRPLRGIRRRACPQRAGVPGSRPRLAREERGSGRHKDALESLQRHHRRTGGCEKGQPPGRTAWRALHGRCRRRK